MAETRVCPLMSMTDPLKRVGDYPKCTQEKCAWWVKSKGECIVVALEDSFDLHDSSEPLRQLASYAYELKNAFEQYQSAGSALHSLGMLSSFVQEHSLNLGIIIRALAAKVDG